ncbi:TonB-dependent receptor plug domain-containing protein [Novosphingobium colocasiae]
MASPANAQTPAANQSEQDGSVSAQEAPERGDIIVTARRRNENLQDVPIAITALGGTALATRGVRDAYDLQGQVPSLAITTNTPSRSSVSYAIRGQRTNEAQLLTDPPVGAYFAEVVMPRTYGFGTAFYDIQNIQVLKGVQGTLFGRNMTGGAVLVEPNHPDLGSFRVEGALQYGSYNLKDVYGAVNVPLIPDVLAFRVAGKYRDRDGFTKDISTGRDYDDQHYYAFRPSIEIKLPNFTSYTVFDYLKEDEHGSGAKLIGYTSIDPLNNSPTVIGSQIGATDSGFFPIAAGQPLQNLPEILARDAALGRRLVNYGYVGFGPLDGNPGAPYMRITNWGITNKTTFTAAPSPSRTSSDTERSITSTTATTMVVPPHSSCRFNCRKPKTSAKSSKCRERPLARASSLRSGGTSFANPATTARYRARSRS